MCSHLPTSRSASILPQTVFNQERRRSSLPVVARKTQGNFPLKILYLHVEALAFSKPSKQTNMITRIVQPLYGSKPTHPIAYFGKDTVAPHKAAVYVLVISQHIFPVEIDPSWKLYIQNTLSSLNRYDVSITCIKINDFELSFRFRNVIGSRRGGSDIFDSGPSLVRPIYNLT